MHRLLLSNLSLAVLLSLLLNPVPTSAQRQDGAAIEKRFQQFYAGGNLPAALAELEKLLVVVKTQFGTSHPNYGGILSNLGTLHVALGHYDQAEAIYKQA